MKTIRTKVYQFSELSDSAKQEAIKWFLNKGISHTELSKAFKISRPAITLISLNKTWKHISLTNTELNKIK